MVDFAAKIGSVVNHATKQIVIVEIQGKEVGLIVDEVTEVIQTVHESLSSIL